MLFPQLKWHIISLHHFFSRHNVDLYNGWLPLRQLPHNVIAVYIMPFIAKVPLLFRY
jgi:hypothetical protein